jgi:16S rRNA (cytidine1402-2'-O)-methyltransferase
MEQSLAPGLYIVATPIGNLGDITLRALDVLRAASVVACEDTRVTGKLLSHLGVKKRMVRYDDHSSDETRSYLLGLMAQGPVALVSDAGTPLVSDPGYRLVRDARIAGIAVTTLPGACAAIAAITLSGLPSDRFLFAGFLPAKDKARRDTLRELAGLRATLVFYESAPRLLATLAALDEELPMREVGVARELTKKFEECRTGTPGALADHYRAHPPKGEIVLMVAPPGSDPGADFDIDALLREAMEKAKPSQAAAAVARATGQDRKALYVRALELK